MPQQYNLRLLRSEGIAWIEGLAERLAEKKIPFEIKETQDFAPHHHFGQAMRCEIYVRAENWDQAQEVDQAFYIEQVPDAISHQEDSMQDIEHCPACGALLKGQAESCSECGLGFATPEMIEDEEE